MSLIVLAKYARTTLGARDDRGCVACGRVADPADQDRETQIGDARGRYWCLECAADALANVRRRVDERTGYEYPWRFEDVGPDGQALVRREVQPALKLADVDTQALRTPRRS